jgi:AcrR family transcriptional regulator
MPRIRRPEQFAAEKDRIRRAAEACFMRSGFEGTGIADICREARISSGRFYHYFPAKQSLVEAVAAADDDQSSRWLDDLAAVRTRPAMRKAYARAIRVVAAPEYGLLAVELLAVAGRDPAVAAPFLRSTAAAVDRLAEVLAIHQELGLVRRDTLPADLARQVGLVFDGVIGCALLPSGPVATERLVADAGTAIGRILGDG